MNSNNEYSAVGLCKFLTDRLRDNHLALINSGFYRNQDLPVPKLKKNRVLELVAKSFFDVDSFNHLCSESNKVRPCGIFTGGCTEEDVYKKLNSFSMNLNGIEDISDTVNMIPEYAMMLFYLTIILSNNL